MISYDVRNCDHCRRPISMGQRWVREKIYEPPHPNELPAYRHFHAEPLGAQDLSCWERYWMERELARTAVPIGKTSTMRGATFVS